MNWLVIAFLLGTGCVAGFTAGLLGIGGGLIVVPVALWVLSWQGQVVEHAQQVAVGTSFGVMIVSTFMSMVAQHKRGAIDWVVACSLVMGVGMGTICGAVMAGSISSQKLQAVFILFCYAMAVRTLLGYEVKGGRDLPGPSVLVLVGGTVGFFASLLGIGGGVLNVPFLLYCSVPMKKAVGISSAVSFFVGCSGFLGYAYSGWFIEGLPEYSFGYCYVPLAGCLAVTAMIFSPLGVRASHVLPESLVKKTFAALMLVVGTRLLWNWM